QQQQQQLMLGQAAQALVNVTSPSNVNRIPPHLRNAYQVLSGLQITCGCLLILVCAIGQVVSYGASYSSTAGFWCGAFVIAAGAAGFIANRPHTGCSLCCINTCMVLSIMAALLCINVFVTSLTLLQIHGRTNMFNIGTAVVAAIEGILAVVSAFLSCRASCCCVTTPAPQQQAVQVYQQRQQPIVVVNSPQQIVYPMQQSGYPPQQSGYPPQQSGYPPQAQWSQPCESQPPFNPAYGDLPPPYEPPQASAPSGAKC
ncbi:hypothetical protein BOX15_Mlig020832g2, partial [Macrostomum lignano]